MFLPLNFIPGSNFISLVLRITKGTFEMKFQSKIKLNYHKCKIYCLRTYPYVCHRGMSLLYNLCKSLKMHFSIGVHQR